jgi:hypothetical protein
VPHPVSSISASAAARRGLIDSQLSRPLRDRQMADRPPPAMITIIVTGVRKAHAKEVTPACQPLSSRYVTISNMSVSPTPTNARYSLHPTLTNPHSPFAAIYTPADRRILALSQCFPSLASHLTEEMEEKENVNKNSRIVKFSHQNIVCFLLLNPSTALPARMRREYIVGSVGNHNWRSSTSPKVVIGRCPCWNRAS